MTRNELRLIIMLRRKRRDAVHAVPVVLGVVLAACAPNVGTADRIEDRDRLTGGQIRDTDTTDLYSAIQTLRPQWLGSRGPTSADDPTPTFAQVYVNGTLAGELDVLRRLNVQEIDHVRFWSPGQAATRYGMGHPRGIIEAVLRRR